MPTKSLALSLSGGGARAFCYAGILQALADHHLTPDYLLAHSGAAIMLCYYFSGRKLPQIINDYSHFSLWKYSTLFPFRNKGFINSRKLINHLNRVANNKSLTSLPIKTYITTADFTDFDRPKKKIFSSGNLAELAVASSTLPPLFPPYITKSGRILMDGGLISVFSAGFLRSQGAQVIIGAFPDGLRFTKLPSLIEGQARLVKSINSARGEFELTQEPVDLILRNFSSTAGLNDYHLAQEMFDAGYQKTLKNLPKIRLLLG